MSATSGSEAIITANIESFSGGIGCPPISATVSSRRRSTAAR